jgi:hypothetical protein
MPRFLLVACAALGIAAPAQAALVEISYEIAFESLALTGLPGTLMESTVREAASQAEYVDDAGMIQQGAARLLAFDLDFDFSGTILTGTFTGNAMATITGPVGGTLSGSALTILHDDFHTVFMGSGVATCTNGQCIFGEVFPFELDPIGDLRIEGQGGHPQAIGAPDAPPEIRFVFRAALGEGSTLGIEADMSGNETMRALVPEPSALALLALALTAQALRRAR